MGGGVLSVTDQLVGCQMCMLQARDMFFAVREESVCCFLGEYMQPATHAGAALRSKKAKPNWNQGWFGLLQHGVSLGSLKACLWEQSWGSFLLSACLHWFAEVGL